MSGGQAVLFDKIYHKLKLLDKSFTLQGSIDIASNPWDISVVNDSSAIITLPHEQQLKYIELVPRLKAGRILQLDKQCSY